jgi:N-acetylmuramoyl-L-alanine amidase
LAKHIILDSGHAKTTGGKRSPDSSLMEWEFNNDMQYRLKKRLEELGFKVI